MPNYEIDEANISLKIDDTYSRMKSLPDDPPYFEVYGKQTDSAMNMITIQPIPHNHAMPYGDTDSVIKGIHSYLADDQGLIEVVAGKCKSGRDYIYSIVKSRKEPSGVQYTLCLHIDYPAAALNVMGYFDESGITGTRDTMIFELMIREGKVDRDMNGWTADPYVPNYNKGLLRNLSESEDFDQYFPRHPLSEARTFVALIVNEN